MRVLPAARHYLRDVKFQHHARHEALSLPDWTQLASLAGARFVDALGMVPAALGTFRVRRAIRSLRRHGVRQVRLLFVCYANSSRSQMAEAFANSYGAGLVYARSAGLDPAPRVSVRTRRVMAERGISLDGHCPKSIHAFHLANFNLIVNLSHCSLPAVLVRVLHFPVTDPGGKDDAAYRETRDRVERLIETVVAQLADGARRAGHSGGLLTPAIASAAPQAR
ncbi:MAG: hypothetical protein ABI165_01360 [Bryobacteraceae bacterium]